MPASNATASLLNFIVDRAHMGIFVVNQKREILLWNQFMEIHSERKADTVIGQNLFEAFPELPKKWLDRKIENIFILKNFSFTSWEQRPYLFKFAHNRPVTGGVDCMRQDCTLMPIKDSCGEVQYVCFTLFDVTDTSIYQSKLEETTEKLRELSNRDGLTQLFNRRYVEEALGKEFNRARRYHSKLSVILTDIDFFKKVNDVHGHLAGDEVLREISRRLASGLRGTDTLGRYGGEEFLVVLPETDTQGAYVLAERLRKTVQAKPIEIEGASLIINISLGITELRESTAAYAQLIAEADLALYQSKENGRNCVTLFQPGF
ncbi:MAG TPA: sensor domain-containing diguanylate cyclase [Gammaproteobacteria bacterium]|nr:sensor domain-containing diguanylate cyclase [Gammaproteobacteria bacterium]